MRKKSKSDAPVERHVPVEVTNKMQREIGAFVVSHVQAHPEGVPARALIDAGLDAGYPHHPLRAAMLDAIDQRKIRVSLDWVLSIPGDDG